jgi:hypothetical protein
VSVKSKADGGEQRVRAREGCHFVSAAVMVSYTFLNAQHLDPMAHLFSPRSVSLNVIIVSGPLPCVARATSKRVHIDIEPKREEGTFNAHQFPWLFLLWLQYSAIVSRPRSWSWEERAKHAVSEPSSSASRWSGCLIMLVCEFHLPGACCFSTGRSNLRGERIKRGPM